MNKPIEITEVVKTLMDRMSDSEQKETVAMLKHYIAEYKRTMDAYPNDPSSVAYSFQKLIQESIDHRLSTSKYTINCNKGCAYCCYMKVDITSEEAKLIIDYCKLNQIPIDIDYLTAQTEDFNSIKYADRKCMFLDDDNSCRIYEYRPMACRKLNVVSDPSDCDTEINPGTRVAKMTDPGAEIVACAVYQSTNYGLMSKMLLNELQKGGKNEPIEKK